MDCDGSLNPGDLPRAIAPVRDGAADLVLGARQPAPGSWPLEMVLRAAASGWRVAEIPSRAGRAAAAARR